MKRILCIKMDHLGDALWSLPAFDTLAAGNPDSEIDVLCTPYLRDVFSPYTSLHAIVDYDPTWSLSAKWSVIKSLRQRCYDKAIVLGPVDKVNHLAFLSGAKQRFGYSYRGSLLRSIARPFLLTHSHPHPTDVALASGSPLPHEVTAMLSLVGLINVISPASPTVSYPISAQDNDWACSWLRNNGLTPKAFLVIHFCAKAFPFGWTGAALDDLLNAIQESCPNHQLLITAGPSEMSFLALHQDLWNSRRYVLASGLPLNKTAALLSHAAALVSWDTGIVHLAAAVGVPVVDVFPDRNFDYCTQRWSPWGNGHRLLRQTGNLLNDQIKQDILSSLSEILHPKAKRTIL